MPDKSLTMTIDLRCGDRGCKDKDTYEVSTHTCTDCGAGPFRVTITKGHHRPPRVDCPRCECVRSVLTTPGNGA
jgi:hypothetical protein